MLIDARKLEAGHIDARKLEAGHTIQTDVVVVGAGAAGIPLTVELVKAGREVLLIETGGAGPSSDANELSKGKVLDPRHGALDRYRVRAFGGTTSVWGGRCAPLDPIDFERRDYVEQSGWPIGISDLEPFYRRAHDYLGLGRYEYDATALGGDDDLDTASFHSQMLWRFSQPLHLGRAWLRFLRTHPKATVLLNATCVRLEVGDEGDRIEACELRSSREVPFRVRGREVVLAGGGLETTRLLLVSTSSRHPSGIGDHSGLLGRFYSSHVAGHLGPYRWLGERRLPGLRYQRDQEGIYLRRTLSLRPDEQRRHGLLNLRLTPTVPPLHDPAHGSAVLSSAFLAKRFLLGRIPPEFDAGFGRQHARSLYRQHARNVVGHVPELMAFAPWWAARRLIPRRKIPSMEAKSGPTFHLHFDSEQSPLRDSRVLLDQERDALGVPRLTVDWRVWEGDFSSLERSYRLLNRELEEAGIAVCGEDEESGVERIRAQVGVGSHHIGTTRMAATEELGVVDSECRVFRLRNLWVASSSVFPTSGVANPTLTITAMALRLADRLRRTR